MLLLASYHTDHGLSESGKQRVRHAVTLLNEDQDSFAIVSGGAMQFFPEEFQHRELFLEN